MKREVVDRLCRFRVRSFYFERSRIGRWILLEVECGGVDCLRRGDLIL